MEVEFMSSGSITVIVDDRESRSEVCAHLRAMESVCLQVKRLPAGDYLIGDNLLVERKTVADFCVSIMDGRLFRQASALALTPMRSALILEGTTCDLGKTTMHREALQGAIIALTIVFGVPLLRSGNPEETARLLLYVAHQLRHPKRSTIRRPRYRSSAKLKAQIYILEGLPGIGPARAEALLKRFGSIRSVFLSTEEELAQVDGVGRKTAGGIIRAIE